jgi:DNA invertase Pin-like site-specific DNA recombinase
MTVVDTAEIGSKITTEHRAKLAYVYIRQSSLGQVTHHRESTDMQYQLVSRVTHLGWPQQRVKVIDEDLGKSGASTSERSGFQNLIAEIGLGKVGLVMSFDASRLARNNYDWHRLLELCGIFGSLIADSERVYDPNVFTDRLLLGLTGMMSEAELHQIKRRMHAGEWNKARRAELRLPLPTGLLRTSNEQVILHPDEEIQARIRLVFEKFDQLETARAVQRYLRQEELLLPSRPLRGPAPHEIHWAPARMSLILSILKNPAYAGTYVYGQHTKDPSRSRPSHPGSGIIRRSIDQWPIVVHNVYPAYISWEKFLANQQRLANNRNDYHREHSGAVRKGKALLQGLVRCGRCGARMRLGYSGPHGEYPVYRCEYGMGEYGEPRCQEVRGLGLDAEVERLFLAALKPDRIALSLAALGELEKEHETLKRQRDLHLQRMEYEAERARRQYDAVEPENRLVARTLENAWEEKLLALEKSKQEYARWLKQQRLELTPEDRADILALGAELPRIWNANSTTAAERKQILRYIIKEVIVDQKRAIGKVWLKIVWKTEAVSEHWYNRRVRSYDEYAPSKRIYQRIRELHGQSKLDDEIAAELTAEGLRGPKGCVFSHSTIWLLRQKIELPSVIPTGTHLPAQWEDGVYSVQGAAEAIGVYPGTIRKWLKIGRVYGRQIRKGTPWKVFLSGVQIMQLRDYAQRARRSRKEVL